MTKKSLWLILGLFSLTFLFLNNISATNTCWVETNAATCTNNGGYVLMHVSDTTNAHSELTSQSNYAQVLCCNFGLGDTQCTSNNKILGLSSSTNAHAEAPDLISPNYNINNVCYDSVQYCSSIPSSSNCGVNQTELIYISSGSTQGYTNSHVESSGLSPQNYGTKICCIIKQPSVNVTNPNCQITSASWSTTQTVEGRSVKLNVATSNCAGQQISFDISRHGGGLFGTGSTDCGSINGCTNPSPSTVSISADGTATSTWTAGPADNNSYYFIATVANTNPSVTKQSSDLSVIPLPPECTNSAGADCSIYLNQQTCTNDNNLCNVANNIDPTCGTPGVSCSCQWNTNTNLCEDTINYTNPTPAPTHAECQSGTCTVVQGDGVTSCGVLGASCTIPSVNHAQCVGATCTLVNGSGTNQCQFSADCTGNPVHTECQNNMCVEVFGPGASQCLPTQGSCDITGPTHKGCIGQDQCGLISGSGSDECNTGADCSVTPVSHTECQNNMCVEISGSGVSQCLPVGSSCTTNPTTQHSQCVDSMCVLVNGTGTNQCSADSDCGLVSPAHAECQNSMCVEIPGDGNTSCGVINYSCTIPQNHYSSCVSQLCMFTSGIGTSQCSIGNDCVNLQQNSSIGTCYYHAISNGTCQNNQFLTVSLSARWVWAISNPSHNDPQGISALCVDKTENLICPTQIPLPFFTFYNLVAALLIIAAVYVIIGMRKKKVRIKIV